MKKCSKCHTIKNFSEFYRSNDSKDGLKYWCKLCSKKDTLHWIHNNKSRRNETQRKWRAKNKSKVRGYNLQNKYKLSDTDYTHLLITQKYACYTCHTKIPGHHRSYFCVDHCHKTGKIRALLCHSCNLVLGIVKDSPVILHRLQELLSKNQKEIHGDHH